jgi:hypothetical protein
MKSLFQTQFIGLMLYFIKWNLPQKASVKELESCSDAEQIIYQD